MHTNFADPLSPAREQTLRSAKAHPMRKTAIWIAAMALVWAAFYAGTHGFFSGRASVFGEEAAIARHLETDHGYRSPFDPSPSAKFTSWSPPLYPYLVAGVSMTFPDRWANPVMVAVNVICFAAIACALFLIGTWIGGQKGGMVVSALFLTSPLFVGRIGWLWDDYPALAMFVWLLVAAIWIRQSKGGMVKMLLLGMGLGVFALTNASYALTYPVIILTAAAAPRRLRSIAIACVGFALVLAPWTVRNYERFGRIMFVRAGLPFEVWFGNLPGSDGIMFDNISEHPSGNPSERQLVEQLGEIRYFDYCRQRFWGNYHQNPLAFWRRSACRVYYILAGDPFESLQYPLVPTWRRGPYFISTLLFNGLYLILGLAGVWMALRIGSAPRMLWLFMVAVLSVLPYAVVHVDDRYTMPFHLLLLVPAGMLLRSLWLRVRTGKWRALEQL